MTAPKVIEQDFHRNGVGGAGFHVAIIEHPEHGRMLVVDFGLETESHLDHDWPYVAVLNLDQAAAGNIYMHPTNGQPGGNAWRGDSLSGEFRPVMRDRQNAERTD